LHPIVRNGRTTSILQRAKGDCGWREVRIPCGHDGRAGGIRVADFSEYIAGPYRTMMLADMGADVVKGSACRATPGGTPPPWRPTRAAAGFGREPRQAQHRADLERPEDEISRADCAGADVVVQNYRPGVAERLGLDYQSLSAQDPALVYCENSAFGDKGPYAGRPGFDILSQAATGIVLYENKLERGVPTFISTLAVADLTTGMFMAYAIVSALYARTTSGKGQRIETSLFASGLAAQYRPLLSVEEVDRRCAKGFWRTWRGGARAVCAMKRRRS
jgi:formyl-CoA transferase/CoA:oxalate CoA-transferase